jgi:hypothetical protein
MKIAAGYSSSKRNFARSVWRKAWKSYWLRIIPLAFLFISLNIPHRVFEVLEPKGIGSDSGLWSSTLLILVVSLLTWLGYRQIRNGLEQEMGQGAKLPAPYNNKLLVLASVVITALTLTASYSPHVQGPKLKGMYLSEASFWSLLGTSEPPPTQPTAMPVRKDEVGPKRAVSSRAPAAEQAKQGVPKRSASQKAAAETASGIDAR